MMKKIPEKLLGRSTPPPQYFGNPTTSGNHWTHPNWLFSRFHFSFAEYDNPDNTNFGVLRVMNDDLVQSQRGFGTHPHRDAEICTYIVHGNLTHADSMGSKETLTRGAVQFMTAGRGVSHSEFNNHPTEALRFIQMWFTPNSRGLKPNYGSFVGDYQGRHNKWQLLATSVSDANGNDDDDDAPIKINTDVNIYVTEIDNKIEKELTFELKSGRQAYLLSIENSVIVNDTINNNKLQLDQHDAAEFYGPLQLSFKPIVKEEEKGNDALKVSHILLVEMNADNRGGRKDLSS